MKWCINCLKYASWTNVFILIFPIWWEKNMYFAIIGYGHLYMFTINSVSLDSSFVQILYFPSDLRCSLCWCENYTEVSSCDCRLHLFCSDNFAFYILFDFPFLMISNVYFFFLFCMWWERLRTAFSPDVNYTMLCCLLLPCWAGDDQSWTCSIT